VSKPIQLLIHNGTLLALCDDGMIYCLVAQPVPKWIAFPKIPEKSNKKNIKSPS